MCAHVENVGGEKPQNNKKQQQKSLKSLNKEPQVPNTECSS